MSHNLATQGSVAHACKAIVCSASPTAEGLPCAVPTFPRRVKHGTNSSYVSAVVVAQAKEVVFARKPREAGEDVFVCGECPKTFQSHTAAVEHLMTHFNINLFKCTKCDFSSAYQSSVARHCRTHDKARFISCVFCNYAAAQRDNVVRHLRGVHGLDRKEAGNQIKLMKRK